MKRKFHSNNVEVMEGIKVKDTAKRAIVTVIVFVIIYVLSGPIIGYTNYDMYLKGIEFLSAVIGAGCYWIGSNKNIQHIVNVFCIHIHKCWNFTSQQCYNTLY